MFIDIHVHTRRLPGPPRDESGQTYASPDELLRRYDEIGVERAVVLPGVSPECCHCPQSNEEVIELAEASGGRLIPFCNVDPRFLTNSADAPLDRLLAHYRDRGCKGVGEVTANLPLLDPLVQNLLAHAEAMGMPVTFHLAGRIGGTYGLYDDPGLPQLEQSLRNFPKLTFLGHSQPFWAEMAALRDPDDRHGYPDYGIGEEGAVPRLMRQYPNLHGDLSANSGHNALARDEDYAVGFLSEFQDRLLFGTDICAPDTPTPLVELLLRLRETGRISEAVFSKVARENALKLLGLE